MDMISLLLPIGIILGCNLLTTKQCSSFKERYLGSFTTLNQIKLDDLSRWAKFKALFLIPFLIAISLDLFWLTIFGSFEYACIFASCLGASAFLLSYFKFNVLKEPLVWTDFLLLKEIWISPRFYFAYVKTSIWFALICGIGVALYLLSLLPVNYLSLTVRWLTLLLFLGCVITAYYLLQFKLSYYSLLDSIKLSPLTSFMQQLKELQSAKKLIKKQGLDAYLNNDKYESLVPPPKTATNSHIVLVQAESYCSLSRMGLKQDYRAMEDSNTFTNLGYLDINYLGAYTMRSEFAVLTGINHQALKIFAYDPYVLARKNKLPSLASLLKKYGYTTICLHPNDKRFFARDKVMANLGFDQFLSIAELPNLQHNGHNPSDQALLEYAKTVLDQYADQKVFMFIITMEAHGPWKLDHTNQALLGSKMGDPNQIALELYNKHIASLDTGINNFVKALTKHSSLVLYGDHLPSINLILNAKAALKPDIVGFNLDPQLLRAIHNPLVSSHELFNLVLQQGVKNAQDNV